MSLLVERLRTRRTLVVVFAPLVAVFAVWVALAVVVTGGEQTDADDRVLAARTEQASLAAEIGARSELTPLDVVADVEAAFDGAIPDDVSIDAFVRSLHALAAERGVSIDQVAPLDLTGAATGNQTLPNGVSAIPVSVTGRGTYAQVLPFVDDLNAADRLVVIDSLSIAADEEATGFVTLDLSFRLFTTAEAAVDPSEDPFAFDDEFADEFAEGDDDFADALDPVLEGDG